MELITMRTWLLCYMLAVFLCAMVAINRPPPPD